MVISSYVLMFGACRRLILSRLLCLLLFLFLFLVFSLHLLYVEVPRSNTQFGPNVTHSDLFPYSLAEAVPVQVPNIVDCGPAGVLTSGSKFFLSFQLLLDQSFVSFTMHVLHGSFFPSNTPTNMKLSQSDSDDSATIRIRP